MNCKKRFTLFIKNFVFYFTFCVQVFLIVKFLLQWYHGLAQELK